MNLTTSKPLSLGSRRIFAGTHSRVHSKRLSLVVNSRLVLLPTGNGSCGHLDTVYDRPGPLELKEGQLMEIGRSLPADLVIPIPTVSTRHAIVRVEGGKVSVTDLNSTNGTFVDDAELVPMRTTELPVGGEVVFGDMFLAKFQLNKIEEENGAVSKDTSDASSESLNSGEPIDVELA